MTDPKPRMLSICGPQKKICDLLAYDPAADLAAAKPRTGPSPIIQTEKGVKAGRISVTRKYPWTGYGWVSQDYHNECGVSSATTNTATTSPLVSMSEYWHSDRLGINLLSIRSSPFSGSQTLAITELTGGEPGEQLFQLPDSPVHDQQRTRRSPGRPPRQGRKMHATGSTSISSKT